MPLDAKEKKFLRELYTELYVLRRTVEHITANNGDLDIPSDDDMEWFKVDAASAIDRLETVIREEPK